MCGEETEAGDHVGHGHLRAMMERGRGGVQPGEGADTERGRREHRAGRHLQLLQLCFVHALGFGSAVLEPDFDLRLRETERGGELGALRDGQVLLLTELPLQREQLRRRERGAGLPVSLVLFEGARLRVDPWRGANVGT